MEYSSSQWLEIELFRQYFIFQSGPLRLLSFYLCLADNFMHHSVAILIVTFHHRHKYSVHLLAFLNSNVSCGVILFRFKMEAVEKELYSRVTRRTFWKQMFTSIIIIMDAK